MKLCCCIVELLLLLLLLLHAEAQSGDGDTDTELRASCTSDIMTNENSLTCKLVGGGSDDEDEEQDATCIKKMTACYNDFSSSSMRCVSADSDTLSSRYLSALVNLTVTIHPKRGCNVTTTVDLKKIVKLRRPQVWNVTFSPESNQAVVYIHTPYHNEYVKVENQLFELLIWTSRSKNITHNISSSDTMVIGMENFRRNSEYWAKVRALPHNFLRGTWSEWSETFRFFTPADENKAGGLQTEQQLHMHALIVSLVFVAVVTSSIVFFWKNKIFTYMWPNIPHPKHTLVQICQPNNGVMLNFKPEVFSPLKVCPMEETPKQPCEELSVAAAAESSTQSSDCSRSTTSVSTEESALLSQSSSDGEDSVQSSRPSPINILQLEERPHTPQPELSSGKNEAEAYVTMSSFYQIK